jgi:hypothetical protein
MSRSPKVEVAVVTALHESQKKRGAEVEIFVPFKDIVFSTRNGKVYLPPTIAKGLEEFKKWAKGSPGVRTDGIPLHVRLRPGRGAYHYREWRIDSSFRADTVAHETMHFVQAVGELLLNFAKGKGYVVEKIEAIPGPRGSTVVGVKREDGTYRPLDTRTYGMPKRRSKTHYYRLAFSRDRAKGWHHGERDIEFMSNALSYGMWAAHDATPEADETALARILTYFLRRGALADGTLSRSSPTRMRDFTKAAWDNAVHEFNQLHSGDISRELTPELRTILRLPAAQQARPAPKPRRKAAAPPPVPPAPARVARTRARPPARPPTPPPPPPPAPPAPRARTQPPKQKAATPRQGAALPQGLHIVRESVGGRPAFCIYRGSENTGKYAFSEAKAKEIMGRFRA